MAVTAPEVLEKQPNEKRQYSVSFENLLATGETIASITSVGSALIGGDTTDLVITGSAISGDDKIIFWIAGGTHNNRYRVEVVVVTSTGAILEGDGILKISDRS